MSSVSSTSNSNAAYYAMQKKMFDKLDSDENGNLDEKEFLAGKPKSTSKDKASEVYDALDTNRSGSITMAEFAAGTQSVAGMGPISQLSSDALDVLMQLQQQGGAMANTGGGSSAGSDAGYDALDINKDGVVSEEEFLAANPDQTAETEAEAKKLFESLDTDRTDGISKQEFDAAADVSMPPRLMVPQDAMAATFNDAYGLFDLLDVGSQEATTSAA
ncbi:MAG: transaldolase/EF-hand protein [Rhizobium sp.]|nr:transaldolase/EF-hand protein [Rhizobium sp.]